MNLNPGSVTNQLDSLAQVKAKSASWYVIYNSHYNNYFLLINFHVLGTVYILFANTIISLPERYYVHFTDENSEVHRKGQRP